MKIKNPNELKVGELIKFDRTWSIYKNGLRYYLSPLKKIILLKIKFYIHLTKIKFLHEGKIYTTSISNDEFKMGKILKD